MSSHPYRPGASSILGQVHRPLIDVEALSEITGEWLFIENALADTGADASLLPLDLGAQLVDDVIAGPRHNVRGAVPGATLPVHLHSITYRLGRRRFDAPTLIAESPEVPPIIGRHGALDRWRATYSRGQVLRIRK